MEYHQNGLHHGDILLCLQCSLTDKTLEAGKVYVLISDGKIITRRWKAMNGDKLIWTSDDPNYEQLELSSDAIQELWEVKGVYSTYLNPPKMLEEKVMILERKMEEFSKRLGNLKK